MKSRHKLDDSDVEYMVDHVIRTHSAWLQSLKSFGNAPHNVTIPDEDIPLYLERMRTKSRLEITPCLKTTVQKGLHKDQDYDKCVSMVQELKQAIAVSREQPSADCFRGVDEKIYEHLNQLFPGEKANDDGW